MFNKAKLGLDERDGDLFLFLTLPRNRNRILLWDRDALSLRMMRLEKTERYGKGERVIPLWPELRTELDALLAIVQPGVKVPLDSFVVQKYRSTENKPAHPAGPNRGCGWGGEVA